MDRRRPALTLSECAAEDLPYLITLWHKPEVIRYADEFPRLRGWSKRDDLDKAWRLFGRMRSWRNHRIMDLTRARFEELYDQDEKNA